MDISANFTKQDFEVWIDHIVMADMGEDKSMVPLGKSYISGYYTRDRNAYVASRIHIDPSYKDKGVRERLLDAAKKIAEKHHCKFIDDLNDSQRTLRRSIGMRAFNTRVAVPSSGVSKPEDNPQKKPTIRRDVQQTIFNITDEIARALRDPQGSSPGDARWSVSGLSHSSWSMNHPDIMEDGESPLVLRIRKLPNNKWVALGQNKLTNLLNTKVLSQKDTPPGGHDWEDVKNFALTAAAYFLNEKERILQVKQEMTPNIPPGYAYPPPQQQGVGGAGGIMGSRRNMRMRKAAEFTMSIPDAIKILGITPTGDIGKDKKNLRELALRFHPDKNQGQASKQMQAINVLMNTFIREGKPLEFVSRQEQPQQQTQQQAYSPTSNQGQVLSFVSGQLTKVITGIERLLPAISGPNPNFSARAAQAQINALITIIRSNAANSIYINLKQDITTDKKIGLVYRNLLQLAEDLTFISERLGTNRDALGNSRNLAHALDSIKKLQNYITPQQNPPRASATINNLRRAERIASLLDQKFGNQVWYHHSEVINDRAGVGLRVVAHRPPPRALRTSVEGIPVILGGPAVGMLRRVARENRCRRLAHGITATTPVMWHTATPEDDTVSDEDRGRIDKHQKLLKKVYNYLKNRKRLYGSAKYLAYKLQIPMDDLVKVIGHLIVEGKLGINKKRKFQPLPPPHTPIPGMRESTGSTLGIDEGYGDDKRVDQLMSQSNYQFNLFENDVNDRDLRERPNKIMPDQRAPN